MKSSQDDDEKSIIKLHENFREKLRNFSATWTGTLRSPFGPIDFPSDSFLSLYFIFFAVDVSGMPEFGLFFSSRGEREENLSRFGLRTRKLLFALSVPGSRIQSLVFKFSLAYTYLRES